MAASTGIQLAQGIRRKIEELKKVCEGLDESTASRAPAGDGLPKKSFPTFGDPKDPAIYRSFKPFSTGRPPGSTLNLRILFSLRSVPG